MDSGLNFNIHLTTDTKSAHDHHENISRIKGLIRAFIFSRLGHCKALVTGLSKKKVDQGATATNGSGPTDASDQPRHEAPGPPYVARRPSCPRVPN